MKLLLAIAIFLAAMKVQASTPEEFIGCYDCSPYSKQSVALQKAFELGAPESVLNVIDLATSDVTTFQYQEASDGTLGVGSYSIIQVAPNQDLIDSANQAASYSASTGVVWPTGREGIRTAPELLRHAQKDRILDDWMHNDHPFRYWSATVVSFFGGAFFEILQGIPIKITFEDGSSVHVKTMDWDSATSLKMSYLEGSALDADQNEVPTTLQGYNKVFFLTAQNVDSWTATATAYGVQVENSFTSTGEPEQPLETNCYRKPASEDNIVVCVIVKRTENSVNPL